MRGATVLGLVGLAPFLLISFIALATLAPQLVDPCRTWGDSGGSFQSGGGTSAPAPGCPGGTSWTTQSRGSAIVSMAWLPLGTIAAIGLAYVGLEHARPLVAASAVARSLAIGFPLTIGATVFVAALPALVLAIAMRRAGLAPTGPSLGVGLVAAAGALWLLLVNVVPSLAAYDPAFLVVAFLYPAQLVGVAIACLWPRNFKNRSESLPKA